MTRAVPRCRTHSCKTHRDERVQDYSHVVQSLASNAHRKNATYVAAADVACAMSAD